MQRDEGALLYSATDLIRFAECRHHTVLDLMDLETPLERSAEVFVTARFSS